MIPAADNTGPAAIQAKELTEGEFVNCVFANFRSGLHLSEARSNATNKGDAYDNWTDNTADQYLTTNGGVARYHSLIVKNNTFINCDLKGGNKSASYPITRGTMVSGKNPALYKNVTPATTADITQFTNDGNTMVSSVPGIDFNWSWNAAHTSFANQYHAVPTTNLTSTTIVNYRGAFDATKPSWISDGYYVSMQTMLAANPTDLNNDGVTDINDFSIFIGKFNQLDK
jgi:hypothetical protein